MSAWQTGPFDNDTAADWCGDLDDLLLEERLEKITSTLTVAADEVDYLEAPVGEEAVAAAALVASQSLGEPTLDSAYAPKAPLPEGLAAPEVRALAIRALDRITAAGSELAELWGGRGEAVVGGGHPPAQGGPWRGEPNLPGGCLPCRGHREVPQRSEDTSWRD